MITRILVCILLISSPTFAYWQQNADYQIQVSLNDSTHQLSAFVSINYTNHSPDTLRQMYFHLWPNGYQDSKTALAKQLLKNDKTYLYFGEEQYQGSMDSLDFKINNNKVKWVYDAQHPDIALLQLNEPLLPGKSITITTPFRVKLPLGVVSRLGYSDQSYQITQWYPKPAVYDKSGWHPMPYLDQGEFYSEFGSFDVKITLPENYVVGATGDLVGEFAEKEKAFLEDKVRYTKLFLEENLEDSVSVFSNNLKTLHFHQENIHDFAWFADKRWLVAKGEVTLPNSNKKVTTWSYFLPENADLWKNSIDYINKGILHYSKFVGDYPYQHCTAVDGQLNAGGGMEYPNITIIGETENEFMLEEVIVHEVGHNWFYGILANNERENPWMDEGINSYFERKYFAENYPNAQLSDLLGDILALFLKEDNPKHSAYYFLSYLAYASRGLDEPTNLPSEVYASDHYGAIVYAKSAHIFNYLEQYLGQETMDKAIKSYYEKWKFKHPQPEDFRLELELISGKNLAWFFDGLLNSNNNLDYAVKGASINPETAKFEVLVENKGKVNGPISITGFYKKQIKTTLWFEGFKGTQILEFPNEKYDEVILDYHNDMSDINRNNNRYKSQSLFGGFEPFEFQFLGSVPKSDKNQVFYTPFIGYNASDKMQIGFVLYNSLIQEKRFRYLLMPTYGFGSKQIIGSYKGIYSMYFKNSWIYKINASLEYKKYGIESGFYSGYSDKIEPKIQLLFGANKKFKQQINIRYSATQINIDNVQPLKNEYLTASYQIKNKKTIYPASWHLNAQLINGTHLKLWSEFKQKIVINKKLQSVDLRWFVGVFTGAPMTDATHRFRLTAHNGSEGIVKSGDNLYNLGMTDYLLDDIYLARYQPSTNFLSQQVFMSDGGFRTGLFLGANNSWLSSVNITCPTPTKYVSLFADFAIFPGASSEISSAYTSGVQLNVIKNVFEVYFPIFSSQNITDNYDAAGLSNYPSKIKFLANISQFYNLLD